jgi:hypothetical protein
MLSLVNVISRLMRSHFKTPFTVAYYIKTTGYSNHSVNIITFRLARSDHIKRLLLYFKRYKKIGKIKYISPLYSQLLPFEVKSYFSYWVFKRASTTKLTGYSKFQKLLHKKLNCFFERFQDILKYLNFRK